MTIAEKTVSAIAYTLAREHAGGEGERLQAPFNDVARFLEYELAHLPDYLRPIVKALTVFFDVAGIIHLGGLFHRQEPNERLRQVKAWRSSRLSPCREFIRFYEALSLFALHSR